MAQWAKVFPSSADKIFVSQVDSDSPTGFGLVEKSVSEMKTLLGVPIGTFVGILTMGNGSASPSYSSKINTFDGVTPTFTRSSAGTYVLAIGQTNAVANGIALYQYKYSNVFGALPSGYTLNISETSHGLQFQFLVDSTPTDLGAFVFVYAKVKIEKWTS